MLNSVTRLTPVTGPFFNGCPDHVVTSREDCSLVQVMHTSAEEYGSVSLLQKQFGSKRKAGHCDFWINCGFSQAPCAKPGLPLSLKQVDAQIRCSHLRAHDVYVSQLVHQCVLPARDCQDCGRSSHCQVDGRLTGAFVMPDSNCNDTMNANFYVATKLNPQAVLC